MMLRHPHASRHARLLLLLAACFAKITDAKEARSPEVVLLELHDTLQPVRASVFAGQVAAANRPNVRAILVNLSSPGGTAAATDSMVATMRRSRVPIIVWAGVPATRVSGEALRLLAEADVALVRPGVFLTPLWSEKAPRVTPAMREEGSRSLLGNLLQSSAMHGRHSTVAEDLSSGAHWFSAQEATETGFTDGVANSVGEVVRMARGRRILRAGGTYMLDLSGARVTPVSVSLPESLLLALMNPDLSVLLLSLGLLLIYLEINTPGTVVPGAAGVLLVLLAGHGLLTLGVSFPGLGLCASAIVLLLLEARFAVHGVLAGAGILVLVAGLRLLVNGPLPQLEVGWGMALGTGLGFGGVTATLLVLGLRARRAKVRTGVEAVLGWLAVAQTPLSPEGQVLVRGELWRARLITDDFFVNAGDSVKVLRADGPTLEVTAVPLAATV